MDKRSFEDVVRSIAASEEDVDKLLTAARLERHEGPGRYMTGEQKYSLLLAVIGAAAFMGFLLVMFHPFIF